MAAIVRGRAVIFDLDGTLVDSLEDLADSMNAALQQHGYPVHPVDSYRYFVGDGIRELARRVLPAGQLDEAELTKMVQAMSAEYEQRWNVKSRPYAGISALLDRLGELGLPIAVLSNKPDLFTQKMIANLLPRWQFAPVFGARAGVPVKPDPQGALEIAATWGISPAEIVYLGDTATDMKTAVAAGMQALGATWGFRTREELVSAGARWIVNHPLDVMDWIEGRAAEVSR